MDYKSIKNNNLFSSNRNVNFEKRPIAVLSHPRSGTHLVIDNILEYLSQVGRKKSIINLRGYALDSTNRNI